MKNFAYANCFLAVFFSTAAFNATHAAVLLNDNFDSGSVTDPSSRASGSLASVVKYAISNNTAGEVAIVSGQLDWTGTNATNGDLAVANGSQKWTFVDVNGVPYDWSAQLAGQAYEISFTLGTAWAHPLTFGLSDNAQPGSWTAYTGQNYDFAFGTFGNTWRYGEDGMLSSIEGSAGNSVFDVTIRVNEPEGTVSAFVDNELIATSTVDFENSGRYFSFGEPTSFGGYVDNFVVTVLDPPLSSAPPVVAQASGNWSDPLTWVGNSVPGISFATSEIGVQIPQGITVTLDTPVEIGTLVVNGTLTAATGSVSMIADSVVVQGSSASFELGTENNRYTGDFTLTLKGQPTEVYLPSGHPGDLGARALLALMGGTISLHGEDRLEWTKLAATANVGATSIVVAGAVDWQAGDEIIIAPSRFAFNEFDRMRVGSTSYDSANDTTTVSFQGGQSLNFWHLSEIQELTRPAGINPERTWMADLRAEVALLNRNITIRSRADSLTESGFGGHVMVHGPMSHMGMTMPGAEAYIQSVALKSLGQKSQNGRYPFHWHMGLDSSKGGTIQQYLKDSIIDKSFNRAITIHGTDFALVDNNVAYDYIGHGVFLEDGSERFNVITNNVMFRGQRPQSGEQLLQSEIISNPQNRGPAAYWITNPNNTVNFNVAAGAQGTGYWYAMPTSPMGLSGSEPYYAGLEPHKEPLGSFVGNTAHSLENGFDIFDRLDDSTLPNDLRLNLGWANSELHIFQDFTAYACDEGIYCGLGVGGPSDNNIFDNAVLVDNRSALFLAANIEIRNSVMKADSGYQMVNTPTFYFSYDGPGRIIDCHLIGFNSPSALVVRANGGAVPRPNVLLQGITTDHSEILPFKKDIFGLVGDPKNYTTIFYDVDGTATQTGSAKSIVPDHPFLTTGNEVRPPSWDGYVYNTHVYKNFFVTFQTPGNGINPASMVRTKAGTPDAYAYSEQRLHHHQFPVIINEGFLYTFRLDTPPAGESLLRITNETQNIGSFAYTVCFKGFGSLPGIEVDKFGNTMPDFSVKNSIAEVNASTTPAYYIEPGGDVYVRHTNLGVYDLKWTGAPTAWPLFDTDGDTLTDTNEVAFGINPFVSDQASVQSSHFDAVSDEFVMQINESLFLPDAFIVETSSDLVTWTPMEPVFYEIDPNINGQGTNRLLETKIPMVNDKEFFRLLLATNNPPSIQSIEPLHDAYIQSGTSSNSSVLRVEANNRVSYLQFTVSGTSSISSAELRLTVANDNGNGTIRVFAASHNNWTETNLSDANKPSKGQQLAVYTGPLTNPNTYDFDLSSVVTGDGVYSFILEMDAGGNDVAFSSEEGANSPLLVIIGD